MTARARPIAALICAALLAVTAIVAAVAIGSQSLPLGKVWQALWIDGGDATTQIVRALRLPRALTAFGAGALLAFAGCLMQVLLRNPLADPYVLGLAGGAATGTLAAMLLGLAPIVISAAGWIGSLISVLLVVVFGSRSALDTAMRPSGEDALRLLLVGVALAAGWGALITLLLVIAPDASLRGMLFWLMGDLDGADRPWPVLVAAAIAIAVGFVLGRDLNAVMRGAAWAQTLGVSVGGVRLATLLSASAATAIAVGAAGTVGFVGLLVPNAVRLIAGNDQRWVIPIAMLGGGALLTCADIVARTAAAPLQLPVGAVMALIGVPGFVWLVMRAARS